MPDRLARKTGWWDNPLFLFALVLMAYLPFATLSYPPLVDLPGHIGRYAIQVDAGNSPHLSKWYSFEPRLIGNLGVDLLVQWLGPKYGILTVTKWVTISIPPLTILGMILSSRAVLGHVPPTIGFAAIFAFGQPYMFGFVNYALAVAFALNAFALWVYLAKKNWRTAQWFLFPPIAIAVYVTHIFGWGILGLLVLGYELSLRPDRSEKWYLKVFHAGLRALPLIPPLFHLLLWRGDNPAGATKDIFSIDRKIINFLHSLRDKWLIADLLFLVPVCALLVQALRRDDFAFESRFLWIAAMVGGAFLLMPRMIFGSDFADMRLTPVVVALLILSVGVIAPSKRFAAIVAALGVALFTARLVVLGVAGHSSQSDMAKRAEILLDLPKGSRVLQLLGPPKCINWELPRHFHLAAFNILWNEGFTNAQWDMKGANSVSIHHSDAGFFEHDPSQITRSRRCGTARAPHFNRSIHSFPREAFDYLLVIDGPVPDPAYGEFELVRETNGAKLFRIDVTKARERPIELNFLDEFGVK